MTPTHRPVRGALLAGLAALVTLLLAACSSTAAPTGTAAAAPPESTGDQALIQQLVDDVTVAGTQPHLQALQRIADQNGGNRASPGPGYDASVDYVVGVLRDAGFDVSTPTFVDDSGRRDATVRNVIAQTRTGDPNRVVLAGAHLDSVQEGPGINDNGSGVATLLEIATRLGGSPQVTNVVRFAFWGSEEEGLIGSTEYVKGLSGTERSTLMMYLNLDMVASPNAGYFVMGGVGSRSSQAGPPGSAEIARVLLAQFQQAGVSAEAKAFDGDSDFDAFVEAGVPSGSVETGDDEIMTAEQAARWGGQQGAVHDRCYHTACDTLDNINSTALDKMADAVAGTVAHFASTTGLPRG